MSRMRSTATLAFVLASSILVAPMQRSGFAQTQTQTELEVVTQAGVITEAPPSRITAVHFRFKGGKAPMPVLSGFRLHCGGDRMAVFMEFGGYWGHYPTMELYTLFPALDSLYCFDAVVADHAGRKCVSAFRLNDDEMPAGVKVGKGTYIFPSVAPRKASMIPDRSGSLDGGNYILVGRIEPDGQGERALATARVLAVDTKGRSALDRDDDKIDDWQVVRVGDIVSFGRYPFRYRVVNIVPPDTKGHMVRGHLCKMIGWIELDRKAIRPIEDQGRDSGSKREQ